jgi:hypothetical protein
LFSLVWGVKKNEQKRQYFFRFNSLVHSMRVHDALKADGKRLNPNWTINFIEAQQYHRGNGYDTPYWSTKEGEVRLSVTWKDKRLYLHDNDEEGLHALRKEICWIVATVGPLAASCITYVVPDSLAVIRVEMASVTDADRLVRWAAQGIHFNSFVCGVSFGCSIFQFSPSNLK